MTCSLVIDLYYYQGVNVRQIAQEDRMSFRDIGAILKKKEATANQRLILLDQITSYMVLRSNHDLKRQQQVQQQYKNQIHTDKAIKRILIISPEDDVN